MKFTMSAITAAAILSGGAFATVHAQQAAQKHVLSAPKDAQWGPAPPMLPPGAQIAMLSGDPTKPVPYSIRLKFPAGYTIAPHSHPTDENVVVVSGAVTFGMGNELSKTAPGNRTLRPGGYALVTAGMNHFAFTTTESTIVLYGTGPVDFKYVNPSDDPRNKK